MKKEKRYGSIILQVVVLFLIGIAATGLLTYFSEQNASNEQVKAQTESYATNLGNEVRQAVFEYPAYKWLMQYWYTHWEELDIEYDVLFNQNTRTAKKATQLLQRNPGLLLRYADTATIEALPEQDQKIYAEVIYSWVITRLNELKQTYDIDFLFVVVTEPPYDHQFFLLSAADRGATRGNTYEDVYMLGHQVTVAESQQEAMKSATEKLYHLADAGIYVDYYTYLTSLYDHTVLIGLTYSLESLRSDIAQKTYSGTILSMLSQLGLLLISMLLVYIFVLRPLKGVEQNIRLYRTTKDSAAVQENLQKLRPNNEIGQLSQDVSDLTKEMDAYVEEIQKIASDRQRIQTELNLATQIQAGMLPHIFPPYPDRKEFDIFASMDPAKEVGGDFYDFFFIDPDHLALVIADVSGKGIPAALFMMASKIILHSVAMMGHSPAEILTKTNEAICANNPQEMFVTIWLGILEISTGKLTAANAGHEFPVVKTPQGDFELLKDKHGFVIGGMDGVKYKEYELQLEKGSKLFVYTDGVPEATDKDKTLFGTERLLPALNQYKEASPAEILQGVRAAVDDFVGEAEQFDDLTMLALAYKGPQA